MVASFVQLIGSHIPSCVGPDRMRWKLCKNEAFDSRSLCFSLKRVNGVKFPWKSFWGVKAPLQISFVWTIVWGRILTCDNLM